MRAARRALLTDERDVGGERGAAGRARRCAASRKGVTSLAAMPLARRPRRGRRRCAAPSPRPGSRPRPGSGWRRAGRRAGRGGRACGGRGRWRRGRRGGAAPAGPLSRDQKAGSASWPKAITGTPRVSSTSSVFGRSRIALAPLATTVTGVWASSSRSAETSKLVSAPRWTPPMPPVAKTSMPASRAQIIVAATVVAPVQPSASATARSARDSLRTSRRGGERLELVGRRGRRGSARPTRRWSPARRRRRAPRPRRRGRSRGSPGCGMPWVMIVDSSATSGRRAATRLGDLGGEGERRRDHGGLPVMCRAAAASAARERRLGVAGRRRGRRGARRRRRRRRR